MVTLLSSPPAGTPGAGVFGVRRRIVLQPRLDLPEPGVDVADPIGNAAASRR
jgi:hypothetical protein